jgi:hypothetical protein
VSLRGAIPSHRRAVTLIEVVLFIAIALGITIGGLVFYQQASTARQTQETVRFVQSLVGGVIKACWFALCSGLSVRYAEASTTPGDTPCPASIRPNSAACLAA